MPIIFFCQSHGCCCPVVVPCHCPSIVHPPSELTPRCRSQLNSGRGLSGRLLCFTSFMFTFSFLISEISCDACSQWPHVSLFICVTSAVVNSHKPTSFPSPIIIDPPDEEVKKKRDKSLLKLTQADVEESGRLFIGWVLCGDMRASGLLKVVGFTPHYFQFAKLWWSWTHMQYTSTNEWRVRHILVQAQRSIFPGIWTFVFHV